MNLLKSRDLFPILSAILYFADQLFSAFHRLFCQISNLWDIDPKFSGSISDVNIYNSAKIREVGMPGNCISKNRVFQDFGLQFTDQTNYVNFFWFTAKSYIPRSCKNFIAIPFVVLEILGGISNPQLPLSCLMPLHFFPSKWKNVNTSETLYNGHAL